MEHRRNTKQRQLIIQVLKDTEHPLSINDIYKEICKKIPNIAKSTIYRNIDNLFQQDLIEKYYINDNELFFRIKDKQLHKHYVICESCNKMFDLPLCPIHELEAAMKKNGFTIKDHYIQLTGICKECSCSLNKNKCR